MKNIDPFVENMLYILRDICIYPLHFKIACWKCAWMCANITKSFYETYKCNKTIPCSLDYLKPFTR